MITALLLHRWSERLCHVTATSRDQLADAIDGADQALPIGVTDVEVDDREVGLGGIWLRFADGAITRAQLEAVFGKGEQLARADAKHPFKFMTTVEVAGAPLRCTVIAEYRTADPDENVLGMYLRTDRGRLPATGAN
jgi:hypothetical protein